jgi:hypothetical protein
MHFEKLLAGKYLKAALLDGRDWTVTIKGIRREELPKEKGEKDETESKWIIYFTDAKLGWVANRTNATCLAQMFGTDTDSWVGKRVTIYPTKTPKGEPCIRVRGSPDLEREVSFEFKLPKQRTQRLTMKRTVPGQPLPPDPEPEPQPTDEPQP